MHAPLNPPATLFSPLAIRKEFPIFSTHPDLVFLDTAASAQKPAGVIDGIADFYRKDYANVHRGAYQLSVRSTALFESAREAVCEFLNAGQPAEIVFVRGASEALNLVAQTFGPAFLTAGDEILISELEHHSNIVPWQMLRDKVGARLVVTPIGEDGALDMAAFKARLSPRTKLVAITHVANVTGHVVDIAAVVELAHAVGAKVLVDGCQAAPRLPVDVAELGCDFYVFSGHKCYGPTGIGVLYGKLDLLAAIPPWQGGGDMIETVTFEATTYQAPPHRFEAGTPDISGAVGLELALRFIERVGRKAIGEHEERLTEYAAARLGGIEGVSIVKAGARRCGVVSFVVEGIHPHDLATILDEHKVAVRAGHHCAQPLMDRLGLSATARASFGVYTTEADIDALVEAVKAAKTLFGV